VRDGIIATNFLPFGTAVKIPEIYGDKVFVVEDRMNKRYWQNIDIWFPDRETALEFGRKQIVIEVISS
jgi:3D (Asp-Asp-Asp) domain-containing protein